MANPITRQHVSGAGVGATLGIVLTLAATVIAPFEGFARKPYVDTVGTGHPETWCYGETAADGPPPPFSQVFTKEECQQLLADSLPKYDAQLAKCLKPDVYAALPAHRHAALISTVYNIGGGAFCKSAMARDLNAGNVQRACDDLLGYDHADGRVLAGLQRRRQAERELCLRND